MTISKKDLLNQYETYHCNTPKVVNYSKIDVSLCAVFYIPDDEEHFERFIARIKQYSAKSDSLIHYYKVSPNLAQFDTCDDPLC